MKKLRSKIILTVVLALVLLTSVFVINMVATPTYTRVTFMHSGTSYSEVVADGGSLTLPTPEAKAGGTIYGWFDKAGNFYNCGDTFTPTENTTLYCAEGAEISLSGSLPLSISKGYSYIKLNSNITLNDTINVPNGICYIDLNGNNFVLKTEGDGFVGEDFGLILANSSTKKSTLTHTAAGELAFSINSFAVVSPEKTAKYLSFVIGENVLLKENMNLVTVQKDISQFESALRVDLFGELESGRIIRGNGLNNAVFEIYEGAKLTTSCEYFFEDTNTTAKTAATLIVNGGMLDNKASTSYAKDTALFKALVYAGQFTADTEVFFPLGNYKSTLDGSTGIYTFKECKHDGPLVEHASSCTEPVSLNHFCKYCETVYKYNYVSGVGHSFLPELTQDIVNTPEETIAGCYTLTCTKCGYSTVEYTYPNPATVYVTVGFIDKDDKEQYIRFPATDLYSFDGTEVISFSADALYYETVNKKGETVEVYIPQTSVFHVEIPLGTTEIFGNTFVYNNVETPTGVFLRNDHLKSVYLPVSVKNINKYSFSSMPNLETIYGLENVTGTIDKGAFQQSEGSKLYIEDMVLNAAYIRQDAFRNVRMKTLTFGTGVREFNQDAFKLDGDTISLLKEVFIEGNVLGEGKSVQEVFSYLGKGRSSGHQFDGLNIVFFGHNYVSSDVASTCKELGYDLLTCDRCGFVEKSNYKNEYAPHVYIPYNKESTCQSRGFIGEICTVCEHINVIEDLIYDKTNHSFTHSEVKRAVASGASICVDAYYTLGQCACGAVEPDIAENRSEVYLPDENASHNWREFVLVPSTCGTNGLSRLECRTCKEIVFQATKFKGGHSWGSPIIEVPATCGSGSSGYLQCSVCEKVENVKFNETDPNGHVWDKGTVVTEATADNAGSMLYKCTLCDEEKYEAIPKLTTGKARTFNVFGVSFAFGIGGILLAILLVAGVILVALIIIFALTMTIVITFTNKKKRIAKEKINSDYSSGGKSSASTFHATRTVADQLADINLSSDEIPPDVVIGEDGSIDEEAAFTAYMDAISGFDATRELSIEEDAPKKTEVNADAAWQAYVDAINKDYEETLEISLRESETAQKSFDEISDETVELDLGEELKPIDENPSEEQK